MIFLDKSVKTYVKGFVRGQFWIRYLCKNPGTSINCEAVANKFDSSIRRLRMGVSVQLTLKLYVYSIFSGYNRNLKNEKDCAFYVLELNIEYSFNEELA